MFSRTTCMITNVKKKKLDQIFGLNRFIVAIELFPFLVKRLMRNLFQGHFVSLHYASLPCPTITPPCIILHEKCTPTYANGRFLVLFFSARKKNYDRHVNVLGDLSFISSVCNRARSLKKIFSTQ